MFSRDYPEKLRKILETLKPNLSEEEIDRLTNQFSELGLFAVRLWLEQHSKTIKRGSATEFEEKSEESQSKEIIRGLWWF